MNVLIAVAGSESVAYFARVAALLPLRAAGEVIIAHVIDSAPRAELEVARSRLMRHRPLGSARDADLLRVERERADAGLLLAREGLRAGGVGDELIREVVLRGNPKEELRRLAEREDVSLLVVGGRPDTVGPHSLGKTARYLIDHAPHAGLLIR